MEYLSRSLKTLKEDKKFKYHPRCAKFNLVQLGFADDLLLFCRGEVQLVQILHQQFQKLSAASGLVANPNKSSIYFGGVNQVVQKQIMEIFILPKKVIQFIKTICRRFLWTGDAEPTKKALIAWKRLCSPKAGGGLNFIDVELWNEAAICKLLWNICTRKEKLWVHWIHIYYLKGQAVWNVELKNAS
ncbi:uncharacterized protein LOC142176058 [Nicotiana tabacum]|uniref:Uncharacterized protein LOC142176058 n=1 Tax=Nicotiana tabacum TaxID=4097 RepID=A0AC58TPR5_TOBAC